MSGSGRPSPAGPLRDPFGVRYDGAGLVPVVVQDAADGRVLMLAWANTEAMAATLRTGDVHFYSRSRRTIWRKGESSGNSLRLVGLALDCDGDALLATVMPAGPTCHRGERSCFDPDGTAALRPAADPQPPGGAGGPPGEARPGASRELAEQPHPGGRAEVGDDAGQGFVWLETLWKTIVARAAERPEGSYTARLLAAGVDGPARKVAEEATELLMAAKDDAVAERAGTDRGGTREALTGEAADLVYHALVVLAERGLAPALVVERLRQRHSG